MSRKLSHAHWGSFDAEIIGDRIEAVAPFQHDRDPSALMGSVPSAVHAAFTDATLRGWAIGDEDFLHSLQKTTDRRVLKARPGRPPISKSE